MMEYFSFIHNQGSYKALSDRDLLKKRVKDYWHNIFTVFSLKVLETEKENASVRIRSLEPFNN
jgi:hypothetical protein